MDGDKTIDVKIYKRVEFRPPCQYFPARLLKFRQLRKLGLNQSFPAAPGGAAKINGASH